MYFRGYVIDDKVSYTDKDEKYIWIGMYKVVQHKKNYVAIYNNYGSFITHTTNWRKSTKLAKHLLNAYCEGYEKAKDIFRDY